MPLGQLKLEAVRDVLDRSLATEKDVAATVQLRQFRASVLFGLGDAKGSLQVRATLPLPPSPARPRACYPPLFLLALSARARARCRLSGMCVTVAVSAGILQVRG